MQVFGLPGQMIRNGWAASRLLAAKTPDIEAGRRHDAARGWRRAMADGLAAERADIAVRQTSVSRRHSARDDDLGSIQMQFALT